MAYTKTIALDAGEDLIKSGVKYYLTLLAQGKNGGHHLVDKDTTISKNDVEYPIGYFDETNIDLFIEGFHTISGIKSWFFANTEKVKNGTADYKEVWKLSEKYAEKLIDFFKDSPSYLDDIIKGFESTIKSDNIPMFSDQYRMLLEDRIAELKKAAYDKVIGELKQNH